MFSLTIAATINSVPATNAATGPATLPSAETLPAIADLPDPFVMNDGSRIKTSAEWPARRSELLQSILGYEYGRAPAGAPGAVKADEESSRKLDGVPAMEKSFIVHMGPDLKVSTHLILTIPDGPGPFPVVVKGDLCWKQVPAEYVAAIIRRGYMLAEFDRTDIAPDKLGAPGGIRPLYPDADWGTIAAWAWGFARVNDYLLSRSDVDPKRLIVTGHSRGGKGALLAGALDERVALTVPNGSGCGGAGCFREQRADAEGIADILKHFPYWFSPNLPQFIGHVDKLPFDQHEVRALVAPRALLDTEGLGDHWANPVGAQISFQAAREVYSFLGVPNRIGIHYRPGKHEQNAEDFAALLDFADALFSDKPPVQAFDAVQFPDAPKRFAWKAPALKP